MNCKFNLIIVLFFILNPGFSYKNKALAEPKEVNLSIIIVNIKKDAGNIYQQIKKDISFSTLAKKYSMERISGS